jgi:pathogenesis-related protein 1
MQYRHFLLCLTLLWSAGCANQQQARIPVPSTNGLDGDEEQAMLSYHNEARASVGVAPLHWSKELAQHAAKRGATLAAQGCKLQHNKDSKYGENLFMTSSNRNHEAVIDAAESWGSEKKNYAGQALTKANVSAVGHYTQMVWSITSEIGCAKVACNNQLIVICHYSPIGNQLGAKPY